MAQTQKTIRFNKEADRLVAEISPNYDINYNYSVNQVMHRYSVLCKYLKPEFLENEFMAICQAYNGYVFNTDIELEAKGFSWSIREAISYDENVRTLLDDDPLQTEFPIFLAKIDSLTIPQIIAIFQNVHEFWTPKVE